MIVKSYDERIKQADQSHSIKYQVKLAALEEMNTQMKDEIRLLRQRNTMLSAKNSTCDEDAKRIDDLQQQNDTLVHENANWNEVAWYTNC